MSKFFIDNIEISSDNSDKEDWLMKKTKYRSLF